ncbi:MAG TPA: hypothetical protein PK536_13870, partial [Ignavibacteria bacterium]|nr:hypothetical protein [Ignavibacteria bacterium]
MKILILFFLYFFLSVSLSLAQTISGDHDYSLKSLLKSKPSIEVSYGVSDIKFSGTPYNFSPTGLIELNLGFTSNNTSKFRKNIVSYK